MVLYDIPTNILNVNFVFLFFFGFSWLFISSTENILLTLLNSLPTRKPKHF